MTKAELVRLLEKVPDNVDIIFYDSMAGRVLRPNSVDLGHATKGLYSWEDIPALAKVNCGRVDSSARYPQIWTKL